MQLPVTAVVNAPARHHLQTAVAVQIAEFYPFNIGAKALDVAEGLPLPIGILKQMDMGVALRPQAVKGNGIIALCILFPLRLLGLKIRDNKGREISAALRSLEDKLPGLAAAFEIALKRLPNLLLIALQAGRKQIGFHVHAASWHRQQQQQRAQHPCQKPFHPICLLSPSG